MIVSDGRRPATALQSGGKPLKAREKPGAVTFSRTVPRQLVHREALGEVFLTDMVGLGEREFLCGAQLPRQHAYFSDTICEPSMFDAVLLMESVRQAAFVGAHRQFSVPDGHKFILPGISLSVSRPDALRRGSLPAEMSIFAAVTKVKTTEGLCTGLDYEMQLSIGGDIVASAQTGMRMRTPGAYRRMRDDHRAGRDLKADQTATPLPVLPARVGRAAGKNVVLGDVEVSQDGASATLLVPLDHPSMFDHPQDHIPGMVLVEAGRQLALLAASECCGLSPAKTYLVQWTAKFTQFGEIEVPALARAVVSQPVIDQQGRANAQVGLTFSQDLGPICLATAVVQTHPILPPVGSGLAGSDLAEQRGDTVPVSHAVRG